MVDLVVAGVCGALLYMGDRGRLSFKAATNGAVSGATAGLLAVMAKPVLAQLTSGGLSAVLTDPKTYLIAVLAVLGIVFQQFGLATGKLAPTVAAGSVANPLVAVVLGAALLQEHLARPEWRVVVALAALGMALAAAVVIANAQRHDTGEVPPQAAPETAA